MIPSPSLIGLRNRHIRRWVRVYPVGVLLLNGLALYVLLTSFVTGWMALDYRIAGGALLGGGLKEDPLYELGTSLGFWGTIYFGLNFVLATRWRWVEWLFGGLDKVYRAHNFAGRLALTLLILHGGILILQASPDQALLTTYLLPGVDWGYTTGVVGLLLLVSLVVLTIWVKLSYQAWLASHKWMGVPYVLGGLHAILLQGDWYMIALTAMGSYAWLYTLLWYPTRGTRIEGQLTAVNRKGNLTELMIALDRPVVSQAGQFIFIALPETSGRIAPEVHPFSLSGRPDAHTLRISVKALGDYTRSLVHAQPGDKVAVWGPYGSFGHAYGDATNMVWVAGGIGVTPFLDMLQHEQRRERNLNRRIDFFWTVAQAEDALYLEEIEPARVQLPHLDFHLHVTADQGRLTAKHIAATVGTERFASATFLLCGPQSMMDALRSQLRAQGIRRPEIVIEEFGMR